MTAVSLTASAQSAIEPCADYNRASVMYVNRDYGNFSTNGFELGYVHGFSFTKKVPLFFQTGLKMDMGFWGSSGSDVFDDIKLKGNLDVTTMSFSVPLDIAYKVVLGDSRSVALTPYAGLNAKLNALADVKAKVSAGGQSASETVSLFDDAGMRRFQLGWHVGVGLSFSRLYVGAQYGTDFISIVEEGNHTPTFNIGVGFNF